MALACLPRGRPRTPSAADLSPDRSHHTATPASHFPPSTRHAQSCGIKTQAAAEEERTRAVPRLEIAVPRPVCSQDFDEPTDDRLRAINFILFFFSRYSLGLRSFVLQLLRQAMEIDVIRG